MPSGVEDGILKGMYLLHVGSQGKMRAQLMGSGTILREVLAAAELLSKDFRIPADVWSVTSFNELRRDALEVERWNQLHPDDEPRKSYVEQCLAKRPGPYIAATDYMKIVPDQIQRWVPGQIRVARHGRLWPQRRAQGAARALRGRPALHRGYRAEGAGRRRRARQKTVSQAIKKYGIDPDRPDPVTL